MAKTTPPGEPEPEPGIPQVGHQSLSGNRVERDLIVVRDVGGSVTISTDVERPALPRRWYRQHPWWVGIGVVTLVAVLTATALVWQPWSHTAAVAQAKVTLVTNTRNAVIPTSVAELSAPPVYPPAQAGDHCAAWWANWLPQQHAAQADIDPLVQISAPASADVTVTDARVQVYRTYKPANLSSVTCVTGAGPRIGTLLKVDLDRPHAKPIIVADDGRFEPLLSIPNAVINVDPGHTEYIDVNPQGTTTLFYEWSVQLTVVVDQRSQTFAFGSPRRPLVSWLGTAQITSYDYDFTTHAWKPVAG
jgi:hypothetical protein